MIGVQDPTKQGAVGRIPATDEAVVTSGNYERFFEFEGQRYAHIIDPRTGWPLPYEESPRSVTLVAKNAADADAYATAVTVMGSKAGATFVERTDGIEAVIIDADGGIHVSSGLKDRYEEARPAGGP
jgi:thiamine biosynthesis lipoprotein